MSHEVARTPSAGEKIAVGTGVVTATALKTGAALSNALARSHAQRWLRRSIPRLVSGAKLFTELCDRDLQSTAAALPDADAEKLHTTFAGTRASLLAAFSADSLQEAILLDMERSPQDGAVGALEIRLRMALAPIFRVVDCLAAHQPVVRRFRRQLIQNAAKTLKLDVTPRPGLNIHRSIRRRTFFAVCALPVVFLITVLCLSVYTVGFSGGLHAVVHAVSTEISAMFHRK